MSHGIFARWRRVVGRRVVETRRGVIREDKYRQAEITRDRYLDRLTEQGAIREHPNQRRVEQVLLSLPTDLAFLAGQRSRGGWRVGLAPGP